jgi:alpha-amylase
MATKFFSDGAVHAYFNPYDTPYDAFMNYMNVLSDFEIRLQRLFPDTAEQDQIFKLGTQLIEKDMLIEKQETEISKLSRKIARISPAVKTAKKAVKKSKTPEKKDSGPETNTTRLKEKVVSALKPEDTVKVKLKSGSK